MFVELMTSVYYGFIMVCVYAATSAIVDMSENHKRISESLKQGRESAESISHYLFVLNREFKIYNSINHETHSTDTSIPTADSL